EALRERDDVELGWSDARERPVEHDHAIADHADVVRARVEVEQREGTPCGNELALVADEQRQRDVEPLASLIRASAGQSRGVTELAALLETAPILSEVRVLRARKPAR